jgi:hypothetical protein
VAFNYDLIDNAIIDDLREAVRSGRYHHTLFNWDINPLVALYAESGGNTPFQPADSAMPLGVRHFAVEKYAWAVPNRKALETIAHYGPLVEMGAGNGYWAALLEHKVQIMPFDGFTEDFGFSLEASWSEKLLPGGPEELQRFDPSWTLLLIWPPYNDSFGADCLRQFRGKHVCFVGENAMGCSGDAEFHFLLEHGFEEIERVLLPSWSTASGNLSDDLCVYRRVVPQEHLVDVANAAWEALSEEEDGYMPFHLPQEPLRRNPDEDRNQELGRLEL